MSQNAWHRSEIDSAHIVILCHHEDGSADSSCTETSTPPLICIDICVGRDGCIAGCRDWTGKVGVVYHLQVLLRCMQGPLPTPPINSELMI